MYDFFLDVSRHSNRRIWYGYELKGEGRALNYFERRQMEDSIKEAFETSGLNIDVKAVLYDDIIFVNIKEKSKKKARRTMPIFFALIVEYKYFFCSRKTVSSEFIKLMTTALGYNSSKRINLMGRDLRSLIRLLWNKRQGTLHTENIRQPLVYEPSDPVVR